MTRADVSPHFDGSLRAGASPRAVSRRRLLAGAAALGGALVVPGRAAALVRDGLPGSAGAGSPSPLADPAPPPEAYQPAYTKNWWYWNFHLYDPADPRRPTYNGMGAHVMEHGGDTKGHYQLVTLVTNDPQTGEPDEAGRGWRVAESVPGLVTPSTRTYATSYTSPQGATGEIRRTADESPQRWELTLKPTAPVTLKLTFTSAYAPRIHRLTQEGGGVANAIFWNQATLEGWLRPDGAEPEPVVGVGFLEHVWGSWSRAPQRGVDYLNIHLQDDGRAHGRATAPAGRRSPRRGEGAGAAAVPTWASVYARRTFYQGLPGEAPNDPGDPGSADGEPVLADVGPDLYLTVDGERWHEATDLAVWVIEESGARVPLTEHRRGQPVAVEIEAAFAGGGRLTLELDALPDVTIANPHEAASLGDVHEGAALAAGEVRLPGERGRRRVSGVAQTEHQRYGPQWPY